MIRDTRPNRPITEVRGAVGTRGFSVALREVMGVNCFDFPMSYDNFVAGASDYGTSSDEIYCPCGEGLSWDGSVGDAIRQADHHCATADHPKPRHEP